MTRTAIRHALSALAAVALAALVASGAVAGDTRLQPSESVAKVIVTDPATGTPSADATEPKVLKGLTTKKQGTQNRDDLKSGYIGTHELGHAAKKQKGLTAKKGPKAITSIVSGFNSLDR